MRYSALLLAATFALAEELHTTVLTIGYTNSAGSAVTAVTTYIYDYSNPITSLLTETNSEGIITGNAATYLVTNQPPVQTSQPSVVTSQPPVATIPAGLAPGLYTFVVPVATGNGVNSFTVSVGSSTTVVVTPTPTAATNTAGPSGSNSGSTGSSTSASTASPTHSNAASGLAPVSFGLLSLGSLFAALF